MTKLIVILSLAVSVASAQIRRVPSVIVEYYGSIPPASFHSCPDVEANAKTFAKEITDHIYVMESFPSDQYGSLRPFVSDVGLLPQAQRFIYSYQASVHPAALLFSVDGKYAFHCGDDQGHIVRSHGPDGDPLDLKVAGGKAEIRYFAITPQGMAHVFIIADRPLDEINGQDLMAQVKQRLSTHFIFMYVRNDPWFLGYALDSGPYIFGVNSSP